MEPTQPQPIATWNSARDVWETEQGNLFCEHLAVYSETFPTSGMWVGGTAYALPMSAPRMDGSACSSLLRTPQASEAVGAVSGSAQARKAAGRQPFIAQQIGDLMRD